MIDGVGMLRLQSSKETHFDVVVVGSGFGTLFFLDRYLARRPNSRVLLLERGRYRTHAWQLEQMQNSEIAPEATFRGREGQKPWKFTIGLGGGLNCWYATTPRLHPNDFRLRSRYGVGRDWPLSYDELEPYYVAAERRMSISGGEEMAQVKLATSFWRVRSVSITSPTCRSAPGRDGTWLGEGERWLE